MPFCSVWQIEASGRQNASFELLLSVDLVAGMGHVPNIAPK